MDEIATILEESHPAAQRTLLDSGWADQMQAAIPGSRLVFVPGVGHMLSFEAPARFDEEGRSCLRAAERGQGTRTERADRPLDGDEPADGRTPTPAAIVAVGPFDGASGHDAAGPDGTDGSRPSHCNTCAGRRHL